MIAYVDASVLLRVVLGEAEQLSSWRSLEPVSSELIRVEALRVIERARLAFGVPDAEVAARRSAVLTSLASFSLAPISQPILERASDPFPTSVGTLDAIHLATALALRADLPSLSFATHDREQATAATAMGFEVMGI